MKRILASLLVLALCAPAIAATVVFSDGTANDGIGTFTITAEGTDNIVGLGLDVDVTAGGSITAVAISPATFNIYPDAAHDMELGTPGSYTYGAGTAIANQDAVGQAALSGSFAISVGSLNGASTPGADGAASVVITITVSGNTTIAVQENALRGGIVLTTGAGEDITSGTAGVVSGTITKSIIPPFPSCVDYNITKKKNGATDNVVNVLDINAFIAYVNGAKTGATFVVGPTNPAYDADYNFDSSSAAVNVLDLNKMINFVNTWKTGTTFIVNCATCAGC